MAVTRAELIARLAKGRATKREEAPVAVRDDFMDMAYWESLASDFGVQLPHYGQVATRAKLTKWLHRLGLTTKAYCIWIGCKSYNETVALAEGYGLRSICGMAIEHRDLMLRFAVEDAKSARR